MGSYVYVFFFNFPFFQNFSCSSIPAPICPLPLPRLTLASHLPHTSPLPHSCLILTYPLPLACLILSLPCLTLASPSPHPCLTLNSPLPLPCLTNWFWNHSWVAESFESFRYCEWLNHLESQLRRDSFKTSTPRLQTWLHLIEVMVFPFKFEEGSPFSLKTKKNTFRQSCEGVLNSKTHRHSFYNKWQLIVLPFIGR